MRCAEQQNSSRRNRDGGGGGGRSGGAAASSTMLFQTCAACRKHRSPSSASRACHQPSAAAHRPAPGQIDLFICTSFKCPSGCPLARTCSTASFMEHCSHAASTRAAAARMQWSSSRTRAVDSSCCAIWQASMMVRMAALRLSCAASASCSSSCRPCMIG